MIFSDRKLAQILERTEASANRAFVEARAAVQPESGATWMEVAGAYAMFDGAESPLTQTFGLGVFEAPTHDHFEKLESFFKKRGAEVFHEVSPMADSALLALLNERGYQPIEFTSVLYRSIDESLGVSLNSRLKTRIIDSGEEKMWAQTAAKGWSSEGEGLSDFILEFGQISAKSSFPFLAEIEGEPIATGGLFINETCAVLEGASTIPAGRRQGAQLALLDARLKYAAEQGCQIAMMGALPGSQSQRNAEKHNFRIAYTRIKWHLK